MLFKTKNMLFLKYILSAMYKRIYRRILKRTDYPDHSVRTTFGYQLCLLIYITFFVLYKLLTKNRNYYLDIGTDTVLLILFVSFLIISAIFSTFLNFDWIKKIELTKKQKNKCRMILFLIIIIIILLFNL